MKKYIHKSKYFYGQKISDYGLKHGYIDYATLARAFDAEKYNEIESDMRELRDAEEYPPEIFQYYIISDEGAHILYELTNEIVFYNEELDMYIWGATHWGTGWDYVLTDIPVALEV